MTLKLYKELGWDSLEEGRKKQKLILVSKTLHGDLPSHFSEHFLCHINNNDNYPLRNPRYFNIPYAPTQSYKKSYFPSALDAWNNLDSDTQHLTSISLFKKNKPRSGEATIALFHWASKI